MNKETDDQAELVKAYRDMYRGMIDQDTNLLGELLDDAYVLTHMTGYRQSRYEWLEQVDSGQMRYHSSQEQNVAVQLHGESAVVVGRNVVEATIWGSHGTWPQQLTTDYQRHDGRWIAMSTVATTF
jgi:hypothetical protein